MNTTPLETPAWEANNHEAKTPNHYYITFIKDNSRLVDTAMQIPRY